MMQVAMSACAPRAPDNGVTRMDSSGRPDCPPKHHRRSGGNCERRISKARSSCHGLLREMGLYNAMTKPAPAAARKRCSTSDQGFKLSDNDSAQKS